MTLRILAFTLFFIAFCLQVVSAAEKAAAPIAEKAEAKAGSKAKEFERVHGEMNALLGELAGLQIKFRTADEEKQVEIQQVWKGLIAKGEELEPKLIEAAKAAYAEAPNADAKITEFLKKLLFDRVSADEYESAAEIGKLLMENKCPDRRAANLAGIAAFATNDFDSAEKYLIQAAKDGYFQAASKDDKQAPIGILCLQTAGHYKKAWDKEKSIRRRETDDDNLPRVLFKTNKGDIVIELFENQAPNTVANFISLVQKGFYDKLTFHRVVAGFMVQGGDPNGNGSGGPGYSIACECYKPDHRLHFRGSLSMANAGRDTGGSQFFLTLMPTGHLDGKHTVFGRVVEGMDVLAKLQRRDPGDNEAPRADRIIEAKVIRTRPHDYRPKKVAE